MISMASVESLMRKAAADPHDAASVDAPPPATVEARIAALQALQRRRRRLPERWQSYLVRVGAIILAIALWHLAASMKFAFIIRFDNIPTPDVVGLQFLELARTKEFYKHISVSLQRIGIAYACAATLGILVGIVMGRVKVVEDLIVPYIEILRPIPAVAWIPMAILMWPTEESSIIFITFLGAFFPIVINTVHGVESTPGVLIRAARSLGASRTAIFREVVLPGALPSITAGLAIGMGVSWFSLLAGEIISGQYGIGYFTWAAYTLVQYPNIIIGMLSIGLLGTASTYLVRQVTRPFLRWHTAERR
jgi:NitT/TauT family transport system permease protein